MTSSQFARMPLYNPQTQFVATSDLEEGTWEHAFPTHAINGVLQAEFDDHEYVIANGHPISPATPNTVGSDRDTPGVFRTQSFDMAVFDIRKIPPEVIAAQISLIDLEVFKAIRMEEFSNCNWTKKDKQTLAPNIVAFTQRFNHTSFLVMREILNEESEKARAEVISQFIKIAKKLYEFNSIHSLKAVLSALQSTPIHRLRQTWRHISKKDKSSFDKLEDFLSDNENRKVLREHMDAAKLPCIPHLGLYLTDLCFLHDIPNKGPQVESVLNMIAFCQNSSYDAFNVEHYVQKYLTHVRYIDELQKFFEDENYKISLKYEPSMTPEIRKRHTHHHIITPFSPQITLRTSKSYEDLLTQQAAEGLGDMDTESPFSSNQRNSYMRRSLNTNPSLHSPAKSLSAMKKSMQKRSVPGLSFESQKERFSSSAEVKKVATLPNSFRESPFLVPFNFESSQSKPHSESDAKHSPPVSGSPTPGGHPPSAPQRPFPSSPLSYSKVKGGHKKSHSLGSKSSVLTTMHGGASRLTTMSTRSEHSPEPTSLSLLDDSLLDDTFPFTPTSSTGNASTSGGSSHASLEDFSEGDQLYGRLTGDASLLHDGSYSGDLIKEGILKRKILKQNGNGVSQLRGRSKCLVQLTSKSIIVSKQHKSKKQPSKPTKAVEVLLKACRLKHNDPGEKMGDEQFIINDDDGNSTRYRAKNAGAAVAWVVAITEAMRVEEEREREEAERSLIKL